MNAEHNYCLPYWFEQFSNRVKIKNELCQTDGAVLNPKDKKIPVRSLEDIGLTIHNGNIVVKSKFNYTSEIECKDKFGARRGETCICKAKSVDPCSLDCIFTNDEVKLEETSLNKTQSENKDFFSRDNISNISCTNSYDYEEKIDISETKVDLNGESLVDHQVLNSKFNNEQQLEINLLDPRTGQEDFTVRPVDIMGDIHHLNSDKRFNGSDLITTNLTETVGARSSKTKFKSNKNHGTTNKKTNNLRRFCNINIDVKRHDCPSCQKSFNSRGNLHHHICKTHKDNYNLLKLKTVSRKIYDCPICNEQFISKFFFDEHLSGCLPKAKKLLKIISNTVYNCLECYKQFTSKYNLDGHILNKHKDNKSLLKRISNKIHDCRECNEQFINKSKFARHILSKHKR